MIQFQQSLCVHLQGPKIPDSKPITHDKVLHEELPHLSLAAERICYQ
ncbi:hypothetical protein BVRB_3g052710 [Beta vulgaris subsp. vulgaris]|nr:hypothetical protein BVRB_3g052710 [Beta vulgaris subsp. vulgaris]